MSDVPRILQAANRGDRRAATELLPLPYDALRNPPSVARRRFGANRRGGHPKRRKTARTVETIGPGSHSMRVWTT